MQPNPYIPTPEEIMSRPGIRGYAKRVVMRCHAYGIMTDGALTWIFKSFNLSEA